MQANGDMPRDSSRPTPAFLARFIREFDWERFFDAFPVEEFERIVEDRQERIEQREHEINAAQQDLNRLKAEVATIKQALDARQQFLRERQRRETPVEGPVIKVLGPKQKRAAVLRVMEDHAGESLSPENVREYLARQGLIDPKNETGTPVRIILAQLTEKRILERPKSGSYRLISRDRRLELHGVKAD